MENNIERGNFIRVTFKDGTYKDVENGISLYELSKEYEQNFKCSIIAAIVNNDIKELSYRLNDSCLVQFLDLSTADGIRIYKRSVHFILVKAVYDLFPDRKVIISHSIGKGTYCEVRGQEKLTEDDVKKIKNRMVEIVKQKIRFVKKIIPMDKARELLAKNGRVDRFNAIYYRGKPYVTIYECDGFEDYFYGYMTYDTGYLKLFDLIYHEPGMVVLIPEAENPNVLPKYVEHKKLFNIFMEYKRWGEIMEIPNVGALNQIIKTGEIGDIIRVAEAFHEKKIAIISDMIVSDGAKKRIVLIAGPSSSGKTTFARRLAIQLRIHGIRPVTISLDDYFVDREKTPKDENGEYDFEALEAIDIELFNLHLSKLIAGEEVEIPIFNFAKGVREDKGKKLRIGSNQVLIIEGIHGLNERLTQTIPKENKFKIYVSALTSMNIDDHNRIPTTDTRLIRRIVRDFQFRGSTALNTLKMWKSVRRGEERNIFPFQEEADVMFNSFLIYELGVLKIPAENLLNSIDRECEQYSEAKRLIEFLSYFLPLETREIPLNSILREFIGGSCFHY